MPKWGVIIEILSAGFIACLVGGALIRGMERTGAYGVLFMPVVGYGIGTVIRATAGYSHVLLGAAAAVFAFVAAMVTHVPYSYEMFRVDFGGPPVRSLLLSLTTSVTYPMEASRRFPFYGLILLISLSAAAWRAAS